MYTATYSPDDNKLRLYAVARLDAETYARVKAAGFSWAPKQQLFVAPMWTPDRADLLEELAGEIGDEDTSLIDRAEERADRFTDYHVARAADADQAHKAVAAIADNIPLGQPILVGHHSERHARKDAERIENGMRKAIKLWETSQYWKARAAGAIQHAKYKERPDVRARRIKGIEADRRKQERIKADADRYVTAFELVDQPEKWKAREDGTIPTRQERGHFIAGRLPGGPYLATVQTEGPNATTLHYSAYDVLAPDEQRYRQCPPMDVDTVIAKLQTWRDRTYAYCDRWIAHYDLRLEYERAMLAEAGGLITDRTEYPIVPGGRVLVRGEWVTVIRVNRKEGRICSVTTNARYVAVRGIEEVQDYQPPTVEAAKAAKAVSKQPPIVNEDLPDARHMTKAEFDQKRKFGSAHYRPVASTETYARHRQPICYQGGESRPVFLTDVKVKPRPLADEAIERPQLPAPERTIQPRAYVVPEPTPFDTMRETLKAGVQVVSAPQLFPTPPDIARQVIELADIQAGETVLEPSAGTGNLLRVIVDTVDTEIVAYEINPQLCAGLSRTFPSYRVQARCADFLSVTEGQGQFPKIVMNPPFERGSDVAHIQHARTFLAPGGRLVAICANGPRQQAALKADAVEWIELEAGTFDGTGVRAAIAVFDA